MESLSNSQQTLATQPSQAGQSAQQNQLQANGGVQRTSVGAISAPPDLAAKRIAAHSKIAIDPDTPVLSKRPVGRPRKDGLPAGSVVVDPNAPKPPRRPVGRPRKDGLPPGSVPRTGSVPRRRQTAAPGAFATLDRQQQEQRHQQEQQQLASQQMVQHSTPDYTVNNFAQANTTTPLPADPPQTWQTQTYSTLAAALQPPPPPPSQPNAPAEPVQQVAREPNKAPQLPVNEWVDLLRTTPNTLVHHLVASLHVPNPVSRAGPSLEDSFKMHVLANTPASGGQPIPTVYTTFKTFWLPTSPAWFSMASSGSSTAPAPEHRFLYWDPLPLLFTGVSCPYCGSAIVHHGCIKSGPIKVYDFGRPFFIIGCEYVCQSQACCVTFPGGRKFSSTDPDIMRALPALLRDELPAQLFVNAAHNAFSWDWKPAGVSRSMWAVVQGCLSSGLNKDAILQILRGTQDSAMSSTSSKVEDDRDEHMQVEGALQPEDDESHNEAPGYSGTNQGGQSSVGLPGASMSAPPASAYQIPHPIPAPYFAYGFGSYSYTHPDLKRPLMDQGGSEAQVKRIRHCVKCGSKDCKGKGGRSFCKNACQDCGSTQCVGRNSKRPDKTCADAWS